MGSELPMLIDRKGKLFGKISIIDALVILLIFSAALGAYYKFFMIDKAGTAGKMDTLQYEVRIRGIRQTTVNSVTDGANVFDSQTGNSIGKVISREYTPSLDYVAKTDGTFVLAEKPERYDMTVTIETPGVESPLGYFANGSIEIKRGSGIKLKTKLIEFESQVIDVKKVE